MIMNVSCLCVLCVCHERVGKGKVRIVIELDMLKSLEKEKSGVMWPA
jgi:hypothetical protein